MASTVDALTFDCADPRRLADFWTEVLGYELSDIDEDGAEIVDPAGEGWRLLFLVVPEGKASKNRAHLDLRPPVSMAQEVERVIALGAAVYRYVEEQGSFWTVMHDPEGNEFCILRGPEDGWSPDG
ncbi:MAG TPA: VOC family protein [Actinomycetota bacterium]|nr:VOC family protein [Actinomycetota bacterium]